MASAAQITANQQNAVRSTGPKTEAGKDICSRNATTHGLTAKKFVLTIEEESEYAEMRQALLEAWNPKTAYERVLFEDTVRAHWLWIRAQSAHTAVIEALVQQERKADPKLTPDQALARLFTEDKNAKRIRLVMRYEAAAERTFRKCVQELQRVVTLRAQLEAHRRIGSVSHTASPAGGLQSAEGFSPVPEAFSPAPSQPPARTSRSES